jgi:hypothetical protein
VLHAGTVGTVVREDQSSETVPQSSRVVGALFWGPGWLKEDTAGAVVVVVVVVGKEEGGFQGKSSRAALTHLGMSSKRLNGDDGTWNTRILCLGERSGG